MKKKHMTFMPLKKTCAFTGQPSILEVAIACDIPLNHSCGGMGSCTTCRVYVKDGLGLLEPRNEIEQEHARMRGYPDYERLGCQTSARDGMTVEIPTYAADVRTKP
jgi:ferredoxin